MLFVLRKQKSRGASSRRTPAQIDESNITRYFLIMALEDSLIYSNIVYSYHFFLMARTEPPW